AGSQPFAGFSIGGHIHFSNIKLDAALLRALDNYVGIASFLIENPATAIRRRKKYGHLSEYRLKNHGGFEYRTPGSWLVNREITAAMLCLAKIVSTRYYQMNKNYLNSPEAQEAFYKGDQEYFRELFPDIWNDIEKNDLYGEYEEVLQIIPRMVTAGNIWEESEDIRKAWKLNNGAKKDYTADYSSSSASSSNGPAASSPVVASRQRQVIRSSASTNISYRTTAARGTRSAGSAGGRGNSLSQGRLNVSSTRRTQITR
ncbi:MAG: putative amidoligase domain-containing protein, partial [Chitinophagales bacterium]